ncbi:50S ribosomal protein L28 [Candidatus Wirthbacteria bacterium CG2_30_54_11]|uniref:Large ribosomal subunit protein bL28 n=1 Tax=Candidatus Wirthbacteria bacterium CG2_30_54_11 TaxID=1817892 RepID=A0A1J5IKT4_9BACT|nr:MAG: 50S ribosomal protein L28 [Candidatus Wirthbacteria bacterium CG2_30_54_11]
MSIKCDICGKGSMVGRNVPHSKHRTKKTFLPNLQSHKVMVEGVKKKLKLCTSCLKTIS